MYLHCQYIILLFYARKLMKAIRLKGIYSANGGFIVRIVTSHLLMSIMVYIACLYCVVLLIAFIFLKI